MSIDTRNASVCLVKQSICSRCKKEALSEEHNFCGWCGEPLELEIQIIGEIPEHPEEKINQIIVKLIRCLAAAGGVIPKSIHLDAHLEDLQLDSLGLASLWMEIETEFDLVEISEQAADKIKTLRDLANLILAAPKGIKHALPLQ